MSGRPEPARQVSVPGVAGYVDRIGVRPGETLRVHVNAPSAYALSIVRLGRHAILNPAADEAADRADVDVASTWHHPNATPQSLSAGSYVFVEGDPIPRGSLTLATWLRLWRLPLIDAIQWAWFGILGDLDYPEACRFGLLVDHMGRVCTYAGDGGQFRHEWLHLSEPVMARRLGEWVHLAATMGDDGVRTFVDGHQVYAAAVLAANRVHAPPYGEW